MTSEHLLLTDDERKRFISYCEQQILSNNLLARQLKAVHPVLANRYLAIVNAYIVVIEDLRNVERQTIGG